MNVLSTQHSELDHQATEWTCEGLNKVQTDSPTIKKQMEMEPCNKKMIISKSNFKDPVELLWT